MDNWARLIGWTVVGLVGAGLINELLYQMFPLPKEGVSVMKALAPSVAAAIFLGYCVYRGFKGFKNKDREK